MATVLPRRTSTSAYLGLLARPLAPHADPVWSAARRAWIWLPCTLDASTAQAAWPALGTNRTEAMTCLAALAQTARAESEARFRAFGRSVPGSVAVFDHELRYSAVDGLALGRHGYERDAILGRTLHEVVPPASAEALEPAYRAALAGEDRYLEYSSSDGSRTYGVRVGPVRDEHDALVGGLALSLDITDQKQAESARERLLAEAEVARADATATRDELREQNSRLLELDHLKDDLIALVSHELRTPVTSIRGYVELVLEEEDGSLTAVLRDFLGVVRRNAERLERLIDQLLETARLDGEGLPLLIGPVDLAQLTRDAVGAARPAAEANGLELSLAVDSPSLPALEADGDRLAQVVDNLVSNAIKFTLPGGSVTVRLGGTDEYAQIDVIDTGIGIAADEQERIGTRFFRTRGATDRAIAGTGLGLAISRGMIEAHGGTLRVESAPDEGSTFRVLLPVKAG